MMIHKTDDGFYVISSDHTWLPGAYSDERTARYAFRFPYGELSSLQKQKNEANGGAGGVIAFTDLQELRRSRPKGNE